MGGCVVTETITLDQARLAAHEHAMRTDASYRRMWEFMEGARLEREARKHAAKAGAARRRAHRVPYRGGGLTTHRSRLWSIDNLPMPRAWLTGPRWRSAFGVERRSITEVKPPWANQVRAGRRWVLCFSFEEDVRERVLEEELAPGVLPEWSDPRERIGVHQERHGR